MNRTRAPRDPGYVRCARATVSRSSLSPLPVTTLFIAAIVGGCQDDLAADDLAAGDFSAGTGEPGHAESFGRSVADVAPAVDVENVLSTLRNGTPKRTRTGAALMLDLGNGPPDKAKVTDIFNQVRATYREASYGMQDVIFDVVGPWKLPNKACLTIACCGPSSDRTGNGPTVQQAISSLGKTYDHYFYVYGSATGASGCSTWGDNGSPNSPAKYCSIDWLDRMAISQELGHNMGMEHEHTLSCSGSSWSDSPSSCSTNEYGSRVSFMGLGQGHPHGMHKAHQGWLSGCNVVNTGGGGKFTLMPLEKPCDGVQMLQVPAKMRNAPRATVTFYYVELRTPFGYDSGPVTKPSILLYAGPAIPAPGSHFNHTFLLSPNLTTVGQSFEDPAGGLKITVESIDANSATVNITGATSTGAPTCQGGAMFTQPGPGPESCSAGIGGAGGAGVGGTGGTPAGTGGRTGGTGGAAGGGATTGGTGGGPGTGGRVGTGGSVGTGGAPPGNGGSTGTGGAPIVGTGGSGTGGSSPPGSGGALGTGGTVGTGSGGRGTPLDPDGSVGGCGCSTAGSIPVTLSGSFATVLALGALGWRRRRSRRS